MVYTHFEHRHRFAIWAAARASQRGFASIKQLRDALESTNIREFVRDAETHNIDEARFSTLHAEWCRQAMRHLREDARLKPTFGRVAKLISVYLKVMIVIGGASNCRLAAVIYPPIDSIILRNISKLKNCPEQLRKKLHGLRWTQLEEKDYLELVKELRAVHPAPLPWWSIEENWTAGED